MTWFKIGGDARLGRCASERCGGQPTWRLEADGVGSNYCSGCKARIEAEELLKPSREHLAMLRRQIVEMEAETAANIDRYGRDNREYARRKWEEFGAAVEPMRREIEAVGKVIADYYALQTVPPPIIVPCCSP